MASTLGTAAVHAAGVISTVIMIGALTGVLVWGGRRWGGPALESLFLGDLPEALVPAVLYLLNASVVIAVLVAGLSQLSQLLTTLAWRAGAFRPEQGSGTVSHRVRVEHRGRPSLRGFLDEEVLVDGDVVGPSVGTGQFGSKGCQSFYRQHEDSQDVDYYLRCWGTGPDASHVLFRDGELWSEKRSGGISGAIVGAVLAVLITEMVGTIVFDTANPPIAVLACAAVLGVFLGVTIDPLLWERNRRLPATPPGNWAAVGDAADERWVLKRES